MRTSSATCPRTAQQEQKVEENWPVNPLSKENFQILLLIFSIFYFVHVVKYLVFDSRQKRRKKRQSSK